MSVAAEVAREAGALIRERVPQTREIRTKASEVDLVTDTDRAADALISERLAAAFPDHARLTEEGGAVDASGCLLYTSPSPRDVEESRMPSSA